MDLQTAFFLFARLGVDVPSLSRREFSLEYFRLAKRYHPAVNPKTSELMACINAARCTILNSYRGPEA